MEPRRKLSSADSAQFIFSLLCLINSAYLLYHHRNGKMCDHYEIFMYFLLFGSLIWLIYLLMTLVIQFRNKGMNMLLASMDWIFILFHICMFVWANFLYFDSNSCSQMWDFWVLIYLIFGYIAFFCVVCVLFMALLRRIKRNKYIQANPDHENLPEPEEYLYEDINNQENTPYV